MVRGVVYTDGKMVPPPPSFWRTAIIRFMDDKDATKELEQQEFQKQAEKLLKNYDTDIHIADGTKSGMSTLRKKPIPLAKTSPHQKDVTCQTCVGVSNWIGLSNRPT